ncbi:MULTISPECIES: DUF4190 domain-containing protein [Micromonospora]|uniref:DUF4190 domain-containing protein n=2 Tax=Micromonospora chalcea TaxID=1874 RepID=A0ABX9Y0E8_MICCH|nr:MULTISPECIES: DUF4190 domain-containing protein [Micromonospora]MBQ1068985.1 DUF4190 domain-containing protein [Micromonospora sp. D75]MCT2276039.1 DUF4190 domain-containing protein [Micromonospora chalcea]ODB81722.1 hypothetical protein A8711_14885 [Micromonospora sp. II]PPA59696.1 hypothetical protein BAW75_15705 [Micromonospora chalcea]RQW90714.1 DUF4190 domain-containing protein [Micromonospora chalcea]
MSYPPPPGGWQDPSAAGPHSAPPADPIMPAIPNQPGQADPYAPVADPYAPVADPYAGAKSPYAPPGGDPYAAAMPGYPPPGTYPPPGAYPGYAMPPARTNTMAIVALVLSLVGFASCITAPIGAIMGHVARKQIRETGEQGEGMATAAIIVGWILTALLVAGIIFYIVMIVIAIGASSASSSY